MKIIHFNSMSVSLPIHDDERIEDIEDRLIEAIDGIGDGVVICYKLEVTDEDD